MLNQTAEYALRAVVCLARHEGQAMPTRKIAEITQVPPSYLVKVLQLLVNAGVIRSRRGLNGGIILARKATELSMLDIVQATDPLQRITECPLGIKEHDGNLCGMHRCIDDAIASLSEDFSTTRLSELVAWPCNNPECTDQPKD